MQTCQGEDIPDMTDTFIQWSDTDHERCSGLPAGAHCLHVCNPHHYQGGSIICGEDGNWTVILVFLHLLNLA